MEDTILDTNTRNILYKWNKYFLTLYTKHTYHENILLFRYLIRVKEYFNIQSILTRTFDSLVFLAIFGTVIFIYLLGMKFPRITAIIYLTVLIQNISDSVIEFFGRTIKSNQIFINSFNLDNKYNNYNKYLVSYKKEYVVLAISITLAIILSYLVDSLILLISLFTTAYFTRMIISAIEVESKYYIIFYVIIYIAINCIIYYSVHVFYLILFTVTSAYYLLVIGLILYDTSLFKGLWRDLMRNRKISWNVLIIYDLTVLVSVVINIQHMKMSK